MTTFIRFCILTVLFGFGINSQAANFSVKIDKDTMLIGDHLLLSLSLQYDNGQQAFLPELVDSISVFDIIETYPSDTLNNTISKDYLLTQFNAGRYSIGGLPALIMQSNGQIDTITSNALELIVNTVEVDTTQAFKPIKPVKSLPFPWKQFFKKLGLILLPILIIIALIVLYILRKKQYKIFKEKPKTMLDYYEEAIDKLQQLENQKLWQNDKTKEYYLGLSEILRAYVEGRFGVQAMESTTDELKESLFLEDGLKKKLLEVLKQSDLAKFAKFKPLGDENIKMMKLAKDFVRHTKPKTIKEINAE